MDTVSEMYKNRPSAASAKAKPSSDCNTKTQSTITKQRGPNLCQVKTTYRNTPCVSFSALGRRVWKGRSPKPWFYTFLTSCSGFESISLIFVTADCVFSIARKMRVQRVAEIGLQVLVNCYFLGYWQNNWHHTSYWKIYSRTNTLEMPRTLILPKVHYCDNNSSP
jgi:hypothetical protein